MTTLSLCMIVRDNERTIRPCLESIRPWVDEMIVVDTGSIDRTREIAKGLGAKIYHFDWIDDFSAARNESLRHAGGDWIFWMDSDDTISPECGTKLRELANSRHATNTLGYVMQVVCPCGEEFTVVDHVKMIRNRNDLRFEGRIHEQVLMPIRRLGGEVVRTDIHVMHSGSDQSPEAKRRKTERDLRILRKDLEERPNHPFVLFNFAMTFAENGDHAEALPWIEKCLGASRPEESHVAKTYAYQANSLFQLGRFEESLTACRQGRATHPDDPELLFREAMVLHELKQLDGAIAQYRAILNGNRIDSFRSSDPSIETYKCRFNLGQVYLDARQFSEAELQWRRTLDDRPQYRPSRRAIGNLLLQRERLTAAEVEAEAMLEASELRIDGLHLLARVQEGRGNLAETRKLFKQCCDEFPTEIAPLDEYCRFCVEHSDTDTAVGLLEKMLRLNQEHAAALHNLGSICLQRGENDQAIRYLNESLRVRPCSPATSELLCLALHARDEAAAAPSDGTTSSVSENLTQTPVVRIDARNSAECGMLGSAASLCSECGLSVEVQCDRRLNFVFKAARANRILGKKDKVTWADPPEFVSSSAVRPWHLNKAGWNLAELLLPHSESILQSWEALCNVTLSRKPFASKKARDAAHNLLRSMNSPILALYFPGVGDIAEFPTGFQEKLVHEIVQRTGGSILILVAAEQGGAECDSDRVCTLSVPNDSGSLGQIAAVLSHTDALATSDPTVAGLGSLYSIRTIAFWTNNALPVRLTLPHRNQLNVVLGSMGPNHWKWRVPWNIVEHSGTQFESEWSAELIAQMLGDSRYLPSDCIAADVQLRQWISRCIERSEILRDRNVSFDYLFQEISRRFERPIVVETGTIRAKDDWEGGGYFTFLAGAYIYRRGGLLHSVDVNQQTCEFAREICEPFGQGVRVHCSDSVSFLRSLGGPIDVLYLDSLDTYEPGFAEHALREVEAAFGRLHSESLVVFDDSPAVDRRIAGKGTLAVPWLLDRGWEIKYHSYQVILGRRR